MGVNVSKEQKSGSGKSRKLGVTLASGSITPDLLTSLWEPMVTEDLLKMFLLRLFRDGGLRSIGPKKLARTYSRMIGGEPVIVSGSKTVTPQAVKDYLAEVWYSYVKVLKYHGVMSMASWTSARAADNAEDVAALVGYLTQSIDGDQVSVGAFKNWMSNTPIVDLVTCVLARAMFSLRPSRTSDCLLPTIVTPEYFTTCLAPCQAAWLAWTIRAVECPPWRLIYSTSTHSRSWSQFLKCIVAQGPTLMVVIDQERTSFGLYASTSWQCRSWYYGDRKCFMFGLRPEVRKFEASGRNENFQYLYTGSKDYPNGLGTGGHPGSWGMFIDCGLTAGEVSRKCSTFSEYVRPTSGLTFNIVHLEVWATGYPDLMPDDFGDGALPRVLEHSDVEDWSRMREIIGRLQARSSAPGDFLVAASTEE